MFIELFEKPSRKLPTEKCKRNFLLYFNENIDNVILNRDIASDKLAAFTDLLEVNRCKTLKILHK